MISVLFLVGTAIGWAMIGHVAAKHTVRWRATRRKPRLDPTQERLARIARLEIACGVGVKYGEDALRGVRTRLARSEQRTSEDELKSYGGIIARECWACGEDYKPNEHGDWYARPAISWSFGDNTNPDRDPLDEVLCVPCLANARAELEYGVALAPSLDVHG